MKNRFVGIIIIGIAILIGFIIFSFNSAMTSIVNTSCSHGPTCPMWGTINFQTDLSLGIMAVVAIIGLYLIFFGYEERVITKVKKIREQIDPKKLSKDNYSKAMQGMEADERTVFNHVLDSQGAILQSDLISKTGFTKVKVSRILDKLEVSQLIERRRRGMTNIVVLKPISQ